MKVAVTQFAAGRDTAANLAKVQELIRLSVDAGAELVVCPEASMYPFVGPDESLAAISEPLDGPFVAGVEKAASDAGVTVVAGMFETAPGGKAYNTVVVLGPSGLVGRYRKLHLFDALGWRESAQLSPGEFDGSELCIFRCGEFTVGVLTCYDVRFPELTRSLIDRGATLLALPSAWVAGPLKEDQWSTLVRARAIENTCYVAAADQCAPTYAGRSMVVDPVGVPLAQLTDGEGIAVADITADRVEQVRKRMPSLQHRRFGIAPRPS